MSTKKSVQAKKSDFTTESEALFSVCAKNKLDAKNLKANHSKTLFRWDIVEASSTGSESTNESDYPFGLKTVERTGEENDLQNAIREACEHFGTFEGNIKRVEEKEDEQHFVFTKVRG